MVRIIVRNTFLVAEERNACHEKRSSTSCAPRLQTTSDSPQGYQPRSLAAFGPRAAAADVSAARLCAVYDFPPLAAAKAPAVDAIVLAAPTVAELRRLKQKLADAMKRLPSPSKLEDKASLGDLRNESSITISTMVPDSDLEESCSLSLQLPRSHALESPKAGRGRSRSTAVATTVMIRNIPERYTQQDLADEMDELGLRDLWDFLYLPGDKGMQKNAGYAFVNFVDSDWAQHCLTSLDGHMFQRYAAKLRQRARPRKPATTAYAHVQGAEANMRHYEKAASFGSAKMKEHRPIIQTGVYRPFCNAQVYSECA